MKKLFAVIGLMLIGVLVNAMTLGDIRKDIRYKIHDTTDTVQVSNLRYSDAFLNTRINQVMKEISQGTYPIYNKQLINAVTGQQEYSVSTDTVKIDKVVFLITSATTS